MFQFFWVRVASAWIAALYILMGVLLLVFPVASSTLLVWTLAAGAGIYGISHLWRYVQSHKTDQKNPGDLFLTILPIAFSVFALIWPQAILSVLPLVLGSLLLIDGVGKLPLAIGAIKDRYQGTFPLVLSSLLPVLLGILIIVNPFSTARIVMMVFGASLIVDGVSDFVTVLMEKNSAGSSRRPPSSHSV